jgi:hypothetical protein
LFRNWETGPKFWAGQKTNKKPKKIIKIFISLQPVVY